MQIKITEHLILSSINKFNLQVQVELESSSKHFERGDKLGFCFNKK